MKMKITPLLALLCLLPILQLGGGASLNLKQHIRTMHTMAKSMSVSTRHLLQDELEPPFVSGAVLYDHECSGDYNNPDTCTYNSRILLAADAPSPKSEAGKWVAKLTGASFLCELHKTEDACLGDMENLCTITDDYDSRKDEPVRMCTLGDLAYQNITNEYLLCPNSLMQKVATCSSLQTDDLAMVPDDAKLQDGCISGKDVNCVFSVDVGECLPEEMVKNYNLTDEDVIIQLNAEIDAVSESVWGCCPGVKAYAREQFCASQLSKANCTGECKWRLPGVVEVSPIQLQFGDPPCTLKRNAIRDLVLGDVNTDFANYLKAAEAKCQKIKVNATVNPYACYETTAIKDGPSDKKAATYSQLQLMPGGGENPATCSSAAYPPPATTVLGPVDSNPPTSQENTTIIGVNTTIPSEVKSAVDSQASSANKTATVASSAVMRGLGRAAGTAIAFTLTSLLLMA